MAWRRASFWAALGAPLVVGLVVAFWPKPVPVDLVPVSLGPLIVTVDDEGETRVRDVFVVSAPVAGRSLRIESEVGDPVSADETVVAEIQPIDPAFLDARSEAQARAAVRAAEAEKTLAEARLEEAEAWFEFARGELERARRLSRTDIIAARELDDAERAYKTRKAEVATARAALQVRTFELERAEAELVSPTQTRLNRASCDCISIRAPVDGRILRIVRESEGVVVAGEPLLEIGDPRELEVVVDLLSSDAVRVTPGQRVIIEGWGGDRPLEGRVRRVEPFGFTKISALGIEEQRVNAIVDFTSPAEQWSRLGHGYRVEVGIVVWEAKDVLKVPLTALFRNGSAWAVFVGEKGRARTRLVRVGQRTGFEAEIVAGLAEGERVVAHPSDRVTDGVRIAERSEPS